MTAAPPRPRTTWPASAAALLTAGYGLLKAYWVLGGTALWEIAPLPPDLIEQARTHTAPLWFRITDAATVGLAIVGVLCGLATVRPWGRVLRRRLLLIVLWPVSVLLVLRALLVSAGDLQALAANSLNRTGFWDLVLWSPFFLLWGLAWTATTWTYARTRVPAPA